MPYWLVYVVVMLLWTSSKPYRKQGYSFLYGKLYLSSSEGIASSVGGYALAEGESYGL